MLRKSISVDSFVSVKRGNEPSTPISPTSPGTTTSTTQGATTGIVNRQTRGVTDPPKHQQYFAKAPLPPLPPPSSLALGSPLSVSPSTLTGSQQQQQSTLPPSSFTGGRPRGGSVTMTMTSPGGLGSVSEYERNVVGPGEDDRDRDVVAVAALGGNANAKPPSSTTQYHLHHHPYQLPPHQQQQQQHPTNTTGGGGGRSAYTRRGTTASTTSNTSNTSNSNSVVSPTLSTMSSMSSILSSSGRTSKSGGSESGGDPQREREGEGGDEEDGDEGDEVFRTPPLAPASPAPPIPIPAGAAAIPPLNATGSPAQRGSMQYGGTSQVQAPQPRRATNASLASSNSTTSTTSTTSTSNSTSTSTSSAAAAGSASRSGRPSDASALRPQRGLTLPLPAPAPSTTTNTGTHGTHPHPHLNLHLGTLPKPSLASTSTSTSGSRANATSANTTNANMLQTQGIQAQGIQAQDKVVLAVVGMPGCGKSTAIRKGLNGYELSEAKPVPIQLGAGLFNFTRRIGRVSPSENVPPCELHVLEIDAPSTLAVPAFAIKQQQQGQQGHSTGGTTTGNGVEGVPAFVKSDNSVSAGASASSSIATPTTSTGTAGAGTVGAAPPNPGGVWQDDGAQLDAVIICYDSMDERTFAPVLGLVSAYRAMNLPTLVFACKSDKSDGNAPVGGVGGGVGEGGADGLGPLDSSAGNTAMSTVSVPAVTSTTTATTTTTTTTSSAAAGGGGGKVGIEPVRALEVIKAFDVGLVEVTVKTDLGKDKLRKSFHFMLKTVFRERHKNANGGSEEGFYGFGPAQQQSLGTGPGGVGGSSSGTTGTYMRNPASPDIIRASQVPPWEQAHAQAAILQSEQQQQQLRTQSAHSTRTSTPLGGAATPPPLVQGQTTGRKFSSAQMGIHGHHNPGPRDRDSHHVHGPPAAVPLRGTGSLPGVSSSSSPGVGSVNSGTPTPTPSMIHQPSSSSSSSSAAAAQQSPSQNRERERDQTRHVPPALHNSTTTGVAGAAAGGPPPSSAVGRAFGLGSPTRVRSMGDLMSEHERARNAVGGGVSAAVAVGGGGGAPRAIAVGDHAANSTMRRTAAGSFSVAPGAGVGFGIQGGGVSGGGRSAVASGRNVQTNGGSATTAAGVGGNANAGIRAIETDDSMESLHDGYGEGVVRRGVGFAPTTNGHGGTDGEERERNREGDKDGKPVSGGAGGAKEEGKMASTQWATLDELLDKLLFLAVSGDDPAYITHFLLTYRRFATPRSVLLAMQKRMRQLDNPSGDPMFACFAQMRICNLLEQWIKEYPHDFAVRGTAGALAALIKSIIAKTYMLHYGCEFLPFLELLPSLVDNDAAWACKPDKSSEADGDSEEYRLDEDDADDGDDEDEDDDDGDIGTDVSVSSTAGIAPATPMGMVTAKGRTRSQTFGEGVAFGEFGLEDLAAGLDVSGELLSPVSQQQQHQQHQQQPLSASSPVNYQGNTVGGRERKGSLPLSNKSLSMQSSGSPSQPQPNQVPYLAGMSLLGGSHETQSELSNKQLLKELGKAAVELNAFDSVAIAEEITRCELEVFLRIEPRSWLHYTFVSGKKIPQSDLIAAFNEVSNHLADWVVSLILCHDKVKNRVRQVEKFVEIAQKLRELNNYSALRAFVAAIYCATYEGDPMMEAFRQKCPEQAKALQSWEILLQQSGSHRAYRMALKNTKGPCIPAQEVHMQDLIKVHEGNVDFNEQDPTKIHWGKFHLLGKFITTTTECQIQCRSSPLYDFPQREPIQNILLKEYLMSDDLQKARIAAPDMDDQDYAVPGAGGVERIKEVQRLKRIFFW